MFAARCRIQLFLILSFVCHVLSCNAECGSRSSSLIVEMVKVFSCRVPMYFGVSGSLNELGNGVGLWTLGNERLSKSLWRDICLPCFYCVRGCLRTAYTQKPARIRTNG